MNMKLGSLQMTKYHKVTGRMKIIEYAVRYLIEIELKWSIEELKEKLSWIVLKENGLITLHSYYTGLFNLVNVVYPNKNIYPWELGNSEVPNGTWESKINRINSIKWLVEKLGCDHNKLDRRTFGKYGLSKLLSEYYCDNPKKAITEAFNTRRKNVKVKFGKFIN